MLDKNQILESAINGALYLSEQVTSNGKFIYERDKNGNVLGGNYNQMRHVGCIWAMNCVNTIANIKKIEKNAELAMDYFIKSGLHLIDNKYLCLNDDGKLKLGGNALAYLAINSMINPVVKSCYRELLNGLMNGFWRFINKDTYEIISYIIYKNTGKRKDRTSDHYPGEVALVLAMCEGYYETAIKFIKGLEDNKTPIRGHWLLQALDVLYFKALEKDDDSISQWCLEYARKCVLDFINTIDIWGNKCTPRACKVEGLLSYYRMSGDKIILEWIEKILSEQISKYQDNNRDSLTYGAFIDGGKYRIDFVQHNISALLGYYKLWSK